jgi:hypothetical protein
LMGVLVGSLDAGSPAGELPSPGGAWRSVFGPPHPVANMVSSSTRPGFDIPALSSNDGAIQRWRRAPVSLFCEPKKMRLSSVFAFCSHFGLRIDVCVTRKTLLSRVRKHCRIVPV